MGITSTCILNLFKLLKLIPKFKFPNYDIYGMKVLVEPKWLSTLVLKESYLIYKFWGPGIFALLVLLRPHHKLKLLCQGQSQR